MFGAIYNWTHCKGAANNLIVVIFAELFCALLVTFGLFTRLASIPVIVTMLVALFVAHAGDPFAKREMAFLYLTGYISLLLVGTVALGIRSKWVFKKEGLLGFLLESDSSK